MGATRLGREYLRGRSRLQKMGALFLTCSAYVRRRGLEMGYPADRTIVHSIGVDVERFKPPPTLRRREKSVLFVGRLVEKKGCGSLIEAMVEVQRRCPGGRVGGDRRWPIAPGVRGASGRAGGTMPLFWQSSQPAVVRDWMARAAVFCVPSVVAASGDAEGFGMVFIEAQAMGLPVVSTLSGGIPEAVKHGETGLLVTERDPRGAGGGDSPPDRGRGTVAALQPRGQKTCGRPLQSGPANRAARKCFRAAAGRSIDTVGSTRRSGYQWGN